MIWCYKSGMIKIDFHMHTVATSSDASFEFSLGSLKGYVSSAKLDAIAITNHNMFDLEQFKEIKEELEIFVYPGIEIDIDKGHMLLISDGTNLDDFSEKCAKVFQDNSTKTDCIDVDTLHSIFSNLSQYILIPHYDKRPRVPQKTIDQLKKYITAGEVQSPKKFMYCKKNEESLVPVYFSDSRISTKMDAISVRQTYLKCGDAEFPSLKNALNDKDKVALSADEVGKLFKVFEDGQKLICGLNVVLGKRSSGKSHTLDKISNQFEHTHYIKQFSLVERNEKDDEKKFNQMLRDGESELTHEYLGDLQNVINDLVKVNIDDDERAIGDYVESLLKYAKDSERHDTFSKARLFSEEQYSLPTQNGLKNLIASTQNLIENKEFKSVIKKHLTIDSLKKLIVDLMQQHSKREADCRNKTWINELIVEIQQNLDTRTASTRVKDVELYNIVLNQAKVKQFERVVKNARKDKIICRKHMQRFEIVAKAKPFESVRALKKVSKTNESFSNAFSKYDDPYDFLKGLKDMDGISEADYYKYFVEIEYNIYNEDEHKISGGERAEFNLLQAIQDAQKYDMLLIDEPESSFDNLFLNLTVTATKRPDLSVLSK